MLLLLPSIPKNACQIHRSYEATSSSIKEDFEYLLKWQTPQGMTFISSGKCGQGTPGCCRSSEQGLVVPQQCDPVESRCEELHDGDTKIAHLLDRRVTSLTITKSLKPSSTTMTKSCPNKWLKGSILTKTTQMCFVNTKGGSNGGSVGEMRCLEWTLPFIYRRKAWLVAQYMTHRRSGWCLLAEDNVLRTPNELVVYHASIR